MKFSVIKLLCHVSFLVLLLNDVTLGNRKKKENIQELTDIKEFKKLIKLKTNVLIYFSNGKNSEFLWMLQEVQELIKGEGTIQWVDCSSKEGKKLCKKVKAVPPTNNSEAKLLKHFHNGEFNKDYDRAEKESSIVNFLKDPTGDLPWNEDTSAQAVLHLNDLNSLAKVIKKESGTGILLMAYAPWCGYCKKMKPDYVALAEEMKGEAIVAAIDVNKPENSGARQKYNITGFPTLLYFRNGRLKKHYEGENNKEAMAAFLRNPDAPPPVKPKEIEWADEPSSVHHLSGEIFDDFLKENPSALVMFYAPWCGHCKRMKPEFTSAAEKLLEKGIKGKLAAVDCTKPENSVLSKRFDVNGFPTVKYFKDGELAFDAGSVRDENAIIEFMKDPKEPTPPEPEKPWDAEDTHVVHLNEENFKTILRKKKHALVMFYAPWCGHCKSLKPELIEAAEETKNDPKVLFGAVDCTVHKSLCDQYDVKGFPTIKHFQYFNKEDVQTYDGPRKKADMVDEVSRGRASTGGTGGADSPTEDHWWNGLTGQENVHKLSDANISNFLKNHENVMVMFYAPWCGHCRTAKPEFSLAAHKLSSEASTSKLAAVDCAKHTRLPELFKVRGYPTFKYFHNGVEKGEYNGGRKAHDIFEFMMKPLSTHFHHHKEL